MSALGERFRVSFTADLDDVRAVCVLNWEVTSNAGLGQTDQAIANHISTTYATVWRNCMASVATYRGVRMQKYFPTPARAPVVSTNGAGLGTVSSDVQGPQLAGLITWRTGNAGRRWRGRSYVPFVPETMNDATGRPTAAYGIVLDALATALRTAVILDAGGPNEVVLQLKLQSRKVPADATFINAHVSRLYYGVIRRRGRGSGVDLTQVSP